MKDKQVYTHPSDCSDRSAAALDRKQRAAVVLRREERRAAFARAEWFDWLPSPATRKSTTPRQFA